MERHKFYWSANASSPSHPVQRARVADPCESSSVVPGIIFQCVRSFSAGKPGPIAWLERVLCLHRCHKTIVYFIVVTIGLWSSQSLSWSFDPVFRRPNSPVPCLHTSSSSTIRDFQCRSRYGRGKRRQTSQGAYSSNEVEFLLQHFGESHASSYILCGHSDHSLVGVCGEALLRREGFAKHAASFLKSLVSALGKDGPVSPCLPFALQVLVRNQVGLPGPSSETLFSLVSQRLSRTTFPLLYHVQVQSQSNDVTVQLVRRASAETR